MELTLGPVLFERNPDDFLRFYEEAAKMDVDRVYIGEVVCTRKLGFSSSDLKAIIKLLEDAGKKVMLSSLAVISNEDELEFTRSLLAHPCSIEANDMAVFNMVDTAVREVFAGPHITAYNAQTIEFLKSIGVKRVTFPVELSRESFEHCIRHTGIFGEVFAHGKVPLAFSWRCYTSRAFGLTKTGCKHHCMKYPDGMDLKTVDGEPIFSVNGTSVLSADTYTLIEFVDDLRRPPGLCGYPHSTGIPGRSWKFRPA
jgi:collagenase-like PrtC family protease